MADLGALSVDSLRVMTLLVVLNLFANTQMHCVGTNTSTYIVISEI